MCAYLLNTVLFLIAGVSLGEIFYGAAVGFDDDGINDMDFWGYMPLLYAVCLFARTATVALFYPLMKFAASRGVGTKIDWRKAAVLIWGGLRGAVGLALALVVRHTEYDFDMWPSDRNGSLPVQQGVTKELKHLYCRDVPQLILMATCSMIFLTVVVNGSTMARLMRALGLDQPTEDRRYMMSEAAKKLHIETDKFLEKLKKEESHLDSADYATVQDRFLYLTNKLEADLMLDTDDIAIAMAQQALNVERNSFQHQFERGELSEAGVTRLTLMWESLQVSLTEGGPAERQRRYEKCIEKLEQETSVMRSSKLKEGWRKVNGDSGTYYQHKVNGDTRWDKPLKEDTGRSFSFLAAAQRWPTLNRLVQPLIDKRKFRELALSYEMRRAYLKAQEALEHAVRHDDHDPDERVTVGASPMLGEASTKASPAHSARQTMGTRTTATATPERSGLASLSGLAPSSGGRTAASTPPGSGFDSVRMSTAPAASERATAASERVSTYGGQTMVVQGGLVVGGGQTPPTSASVALQRVAPLPEPSSSRQPPRLPSSSSLGVSLHDEESKPLGVKSEHILRSLRHSNHNITAKDVNAKMNDEMEMRAKFRERIDKRLSIMMEDDLDISRAVETRYVATLALRKQRDVLEDLLHHGEISKLDAAKLRGALPALSRPRASSRAPQLSPHPYTRRRDQQDPEEAPLHPPDQHQERGQDDRPALRPRLPIAPPG